MKQLNSSFIVSSSGRDSWPELENPEIVVVGRSNVGKSSFINALTNRKRLAYVGNTPGKTQLLNFFDIDGKWVLVDVPGYGYAKLSKSQLARLGVMMDEYFAHRENLAGVVSLVDSRHAPSKDDLEMIEFFKQTGRKVIIVATKIDKVPKTKRLSTLRKLSQSLKLPMKSIYPVSSVEKTGLDEVYQAILELLGQKEMPEGEKESSEPNRLESEKEQESKPASASAL